ncbi:MAG: ABC transporter ATP-binding protein [Armatimonadetes bacterium]|nr:ABC transporter ATP-binding protein [Armatimonadota bacterium]MDE2205138.1 ABC transporter ATP-binding protein [Armatimonadota bacterium]
MRNFVRFLGEIRAYWRTLALIACLTVCTAALSLPPPLVIQYITDHLSDIALHRHLPISLVGVFAAVVGIAAASAILGYFLSVAITYLGQRFKQDMRRKLYAHMQSLSLGFFEKNQTGKLMSNITNDVATLDQLIGGGFVTVIQDCVTLLAVMFIIFLKSWTLSLVALAVFPIYILNYLAFIGKIKITSHEIREQRDVMLGDLQEKLAGVQVVKSYARERYEVHQFVGETRNLLTLNVRISAMSTGLWTIAEFIGAVGTALLLWYGGRLVIHGAISVGSLVAFYAYVGGYLYGPVLRLIQINDQVARVNAALWRIFNTLDTKPNVKDRDGAEPLPKIRGDVRFEKVVFEYEAGTPVLKGIDLAVTAGQLVALVGESGSGKTTMINLLQRNYDVTSGAITVDGRDVRDVTLASLRRQVGVVIQETILFNTTVRENIRYGRLEATDAEVEEAARAANIAHVIEALPRKYDTRIGEDGVKLSGGEKQRVAIARALLSDPRILILDEATSALDSETEAMIQEALDRLLAGRTSFVVAHRLSTIVKADQIVVMEQGEIKEIGSHTELLQQGGMYAALYTQQFKAALEDSDTARQLLAPAQG